MFLLFVSKNNQQGEHTVEQKYWVGYEIALVLHVETILEEASGSDSRPGNDSKAESNSHYVAQIQKYWTHCQGAKW